MGKSADAFRTISEVAEWLGIPTHVLRFWESKFSQVKPVKRAGGRRYYRPGDMLLLGGIKKLLHDDGMTIKGVQKILRKEGIEHVTQHSQPLDDVTAAEFSEIADQTTTNAAKPSPTQVSEFKSESPQLPEASQAEGKPAAAPATETTKAVPPSSPPPPAEPPQPLSPAETAPVAAPEPQPAEDEPVAPPSETPVAAPSEPPPEKPTEKPTGKLTEKPAEKSTEKSTEIPTEKSPAPPSPEPSPPPLQSEPKPKPKPEPEPAPAPAQISVPADPDDGIAAAPGLLSQLAKLPRPLPPELASKLAPVIARLHKINGAGDPARKN
jgi:DNA-binding transcriptional MerR regulator